MDLLASMIRRSSDNTEKASKNSAEFIRSHSHVNNENNVANTSNPDLSSLEIKVLLDNVIYPEDIASHSFEKSSTGAGMHTHLNY